MTKIINIGLWTTLVMLEVSILVLGLEYSLMETLHFSKGAEYMAFAISAFPLIYLFMVIFNHGYKNDEIGESE